MYTRETFEYIIIVQDSENFPLHYFFYHFRLQPINFSAGYLSNQKHKKLIQLTLQLQLWFVYHLYFSILVVIYLNLFLYIKFLGGLS